MSTVVPKGKAAVTEGNCHMAFSCTPDGDSKPRRDSALHLTQRILKDYKLPPLPII